MLNATIPDISTLPSAVSEAHDHNRHSLQDSGWKAIYGVMALRDIAFLLFSGFDTKVIATDEIISQRGGVSFALLEHTRSPALN